MYSAVSCKCSKFFRAVYYCQSSFKLSDRRDISENRKLQRRALGSFWRGTPWGGLAETMDALYYNIIYIQILVDLE